MKELRSIYSYRLGARKCFAFENPEDCVDYSWLKDGVIIDGVQYKIYSYNCPVMYVNPRPKGEIVEVTVEKAEEEV